MDQSYDEEVIVVTKNKNKKGGKRRPVTDLGYRGIVTNSSGSS